MDVIAAFTANSQATKLMRPTEGALDDPAVDAQPATVLRMASGQKWFDATTAQFFTVWMGVVGAITLHQLRALAGTSAVAMYGRNGIHQGQQLGYVMGVRRC